MTLDAKIIYKSGESMYMNSQFRDIIVKGSSKIIDFEQFARSRNLTNVFIENGVKAIYQYAFAGCEHLENITIPDSVAFIDMGAFMQCTSLRSLNLGDGVIELADHICTLCPNLKTIQIPPSAIKINEDALQYSSIDCIIGYINSCAHEYARNHNIYFKATGTLESSGTCGSNLKWIYDRSQKELLITGHGKMYDYGWQHRAPWRNFQVHSVIIDNDVESIGRCAFLNCIYLKRIEFGQKIKFVHNKAFQFSGVPEHIKIHPKNSSVVQINNNTIINNEKEITFSEFDCFAIE